jgi:hypothetical protein
MTPRQTPFLSGPVLAASGGVALMLLIGLSAAQDFNYDLMNYHVASAHLLLAGELDRNVALSGVQSWFNPIGYVPVYLGIETLPPRLVAALLAIVAGLNAPLIYLIADRVADGLPRPQRLLAGLTCTLIGMTGAITLSEVATSFLDNILSLAELGALLSMLLALDGRQTVRLSWAGLLLGLATGFKLTAGVFAGAMAIALLVSLVRRQITIASFGAFALAGALGFLLTGGWWTWHLWNAYHNPVFPMANDLFRSPWVVAQPLNDTTFQPKNWTAVFADPWHWLIGDRTPGAEIPVRDPRYAILLAASLLCVAMPRARSNTAWNGEGTRLIALFVLISYLIWLFLFGILRYAVMLEMLSGVLLLATLRAFPRLPTKTMSGVLIVVALTSIAWTRTASWGRAAFTGNWFGVTGIEAVHRPGTVYVMPDDAPLGFMVTLFPADARFVHIGGNLPLDPSTELGRRAADIIAQARVLRTLAGHRTTPQAWRRCGALVSCRCRAAVARSPPRLRPPKAACWRRCAELNAISACRPAAARRSPRDRWASWASPRDRPASVPPAPYRRRAHSDRA